MAKRHADDALEVSAYADSPRSKKAKLAYHDKSAVHNGINLQNIDGQANGGSHGEPPLDASFGQQLLPQEADTEIIQDEEGEEDEEATVFSASSRQTAPLEGYTDLYLDTIDRSVLDFDFEKLCSITLSNINIYACLVCGKYFQGRGPKSHAYFHALEVGHHVYVNMQTKKVYVLPEGYEVKNKSLEDIKFVVDPKLSKEELLRMDREPKDAWDLSGKKYRPGESSFGSISKAIANNRTSRLCWHE